MQDNTQIAPLDEPICSPSSARKYANRGGEIWEWDGQKWRELFSSDAIQRLDYYERKIATLESSVQAAHSAIRFAFDRFERVSWGWDGDCGSKDIIATLEDILPENNRILESHEITKEAD